MNFTKMIKSITNRFDNSSYIDLKDKDSIKIIEIDNKEVLNIKKEINQLEFELDKNINLDILFLYKKEFEKKLSLLNSINAKYLKSKKIIEKEKISEKIKTGYNKLHKNIKATYEICSKLKEKFDKKQEVLNKKNINNDNLKNIKKEKVENYVDKKIDALATIKKMNNDIDMYHKKLVEIKKQQKINKDDTIKYSLYWLKDKIITLKKEYSLLEKRTELKKLKTHMTYENIDTNKLIKSSKAIDTLFELCQTELENFDKIEAINKEKPKKIKEHIKKEKYVVYKKDHGLITSSINEDIKNANIEISKIRNLVNKANPKLRNRALYTGINQFMNNTSKLSFSMFPTVLFKNKNIGILVSSILVNNRIRLVRNLILEEKKEISYIDYNNIEKQIETKINCLILSKNIMINSIDQLDKLILEINFKYRNEKDLQSKEICNEITSLKGHIEMLKEEVSDKIKLEKLSV